MNAGFTYRGTIEPSEDGLPLAACLAARHAHSTEEQWRERAAAGKVLLDGRPARADEPVRRGQRVEWVRPPWKEPEVPLEWGLLHEDAHLLAADKPSGLPTLPGAGFLEHTLLALVRARVPGASPAHRLGRGTSGVVLFAKTPDAARALARAWKAGEVLKVYRALVDGEPARDAFAVETPIGPVAHPAGGTVFAASPAGKPAASRVRVLERRGAVSLVEVVIETGRPHQIRVHLAACGHPLAGDPLYAAGGLPRPGTLARPGDLGYRLHALRLSLPHPATDAPFTVESPPPPGL